MGGKSQEGTIEIGLVGVPLVRKRGEDADPGWRVVGKAKEAGVGGPKGRKAARAEEEANKCEDEY